MQQSELQRNKQTKAKALFIINHLNLGDDDNFWSLVHKQALAIENNISRAHNNYSLEGNDASSKSEPPPPPQQKGHKPHDEHMGTSSTNSFAALQDAQDNEDDRSVTIASCDSDADEGLVEPIDVGHHSADEHFSSLVKKHNIPPRISPGSKKSKCHPNMPLNVRLRARKGSSPQPPNLHDFCTK